MEIINKSRNVVLADRAKVADTFFSRMIGLLNRTSFDKGEALVITRCQSIHMLFMKFAIDVLFVDRDDYVVGIVKNIKPFHLSPIFFKASYCVELPAGTLSSTATKVGEQIEIEK